MSCQFPTCNAHAQSNGFCVRHRQYGAPIAKKEQKPIPKQSEKKKAENKVLKQKYAIYLARPENKVCNIQFDEGCTFYATVVNHRRRRGENVLNEKDWEPSCAYCNGKIEEKDGDARDLGHLKSKFTVHDQVENAKVQVHDKI